MTDNPNVILIYGDDLGRGMLSCYGQQHFETPNIDRLANEGMKFNHAYGCAFCAPLPCQYADRSPRLPRRYMDLYPRRIV